MFYERLKVERYWPDIENGLTRDERATPRTRGQEQGSTNS